MNKSKREDICSCRGIIFRFLVASIAFLRNFISNSTKTANDNRPKPRVATLHLGVGNKRNRLLSLSSLITTTRCLYFHKVSKQLQCKQQLQWSYYHYSLLGLNPPRSGMDKRSGKGSTRRRGKIFYYCLKVCIRSLKKQSYEWLTDSCTSSLFVNRYLQIHKIIANL